MKTLTDVAAELLARKPGPNGLELTRHETALWHRSPELRRALTERSGYQAIVDYRGKLLNPR